MRHRIEVERTPPGQNALAIKTGVGGLMDAEFAAQVMCLANGWQLPNTMAALVCARDTKAMDPAVSEPLIENYRLLRRIEAILRRWSFAGETVLPQDEAPFYRVAVRCGFRGAEDFRQALGKYRQAIRTAFQAVFG